MSRIYNVQFWPSPIFNSLLISFKHLTSGIFNFQFSIFNSYDECFNR
jgi:hypothetical protein